MEGIGGVRFYAMEGVRFYPTEEELFLLLKEKRLDSDFTVHTILDYNIYEYEPSQLFGLPGVRHGEKWCNFYCAPDYMKEDSRKRLQQLNEGYCNESVKRSTKTGYWKVTGTPRFIKAKRSKKEIGLKRTLVFYERPLGSKEIKTNWVMHEFVIRYDPSFKEDFVLCRIKWKRDKKPSISTRIDDRRAKKSRSSTRIDDRRAKKPLTSTRFDDRRAKKPRTSTKKAERREKKACISAKNEKSSVSFNDEAQPSHNVAFHDGIRNYVVENSSPESNWDAISNRNHVAENIPPGSRPGAEFLPVAGCDSMFNSGHQVAEAPEYTLQVDPLLHVKQNLLSACNVLDLTSFLALQSPIFQELQPLPGCDSMSNSGHHVAGDPQYTSLVDPLLPVKPNVLSGCCGLDHTSFFSQQSPIYPASQPLPSCDLISNCGHHVAEAPQYTSQEDPRLVIQLAHNGCSGLDQTSCFAPQSLIYPESQLLPSCDWSSNFSHHVAEFPKYISQQDPIPVIPSLLNSYSGLDQTSCFSLQSPMHPESQPLPSCNSTSSSAHYVAEAPNYTSQEDPQLVIPSVFNGCSGLDQTSCFSLQSPTYRESHPPSSCDSVSNSGQDAAETPEYTSQVDPLPRSESSSVFTSSGGPEQTSFSAHPEKEFLYSSVKNSDYDVLSCPLGFEWEDYFFFNPPSALQV